MKYSDAKCQNTKYSYLLAYLDLEIKSPILIVKVCNYNQKNVLKVLKVKVLIAEKCPL